MVLTWHKAFAFLNTHEYGEYVALTSLVLVVFGDAFVIISSIEFIVFRAYIYSVNEVY